MVYAQPGHYPFAYLRHGEGESILVVANPADRAAEVELSVEVLPASQELPEVLWGVVFGLTRHSGSWKIVLPGVSAGIYKF